MKKFMVISSVLFAMVSANAHNIWLEQDPSMKDSYTLKFGHEETETYPESKVTSIKLLSTDGSVKDAKTIYQNGEIHLNAEGASIIFMRFNNGVWSKLPSGKYVEKTKKEAPDAEFSVNPLKEGKAVLNWDEQAYKLHNVEYELVLQSKPMANKPVDILVLHNGKPVEGIKLGLGEDKPFVLTNSQGIAAFTPTKGINKVWAEFEEDIPNNPDYTNRSIEYMLTFAAE